MVSAQRRGLTRLGCLLVLAVLAAIGYFGYNVGEVYFRYFRYRDAMRQEVRFGGRRSDELIRTRLQAVADSLGLPEAAGNVQIRRSRNHIEIWAEYYDHVELPAFVREIHFNPTAQRTF